MDKFTSVQKIFLYSAILIFMTFILLPFVEMFYASLRPLDHLFRSPYQFYSDDFPSGLIEKCGIQFQCYLDIFLIVFF